VKQKEHADEIDERQRKKNLRQKEMDTKRWLDLQMREKAEKKKVERFGDDLEAHEIVKDVNDY